MNRNETADLLSVIATYDQRTIGEADVEAWFAALGEMHYREARDAVVEHHKTSTDRIRPVHVLDLARRASNDRIERASASPVYRDQRDAERDGRLARLLGGSPAALGTSAERSQPASEATRKAVMAQTAKFFRIETSQEKAMRIHLEYVAKNEGGAMAA
ncbi:MAG: hypothetical protein JWN03_7854 [Nocardia sp.]|uniref:hypothetical protein n=1 Tax=Nocardia sp. TaxID=1821 RepID=UPI00262C674A|nr:hypothetical protein [Nocardia sp.]MCU1647579.1 hypothetical protein [Nocardia sp.]